MISTATIKSGGTSVSRADGALVLVNPRSFRMSLRGRLPRIVELIKKRGATLVEVFEPNAIRDSLQVALDQDCKLLVIIGGDGTVQAAVTALAEMAEPEQRPRILVLGGGRTNYTARDIGTHDRLLATLEMALDDPARLNDTERQTLVLEHPSLDEPLHGFFVAGALVDHVIRDCHDYRAKGQGPLRRGHVSSAWRVMQLGLLGLLGRHSFEAPRLSIDAAGLGHIEDSIRLLLLTSLHHRDEWIDPYADRGHGSIRLSAASTSARGFWRRLPRLIRGRYRTDMAPNTGYLSGMSQEVRIKGLAGVSLDGQEVDFDADHPLLIRSGPAFHFLHP